MEFFGFYNIEFETIYIETTGSVSDMVLDVCYKPTTTTPSKSNVMICVYILVCSQKVCHHKDLSISMLQWCLLLLRKVIRHICQLCITKQAQRRAAAGRSWHAQKIPCTSLPGAISTMLKMDFHYTHCFSWEKTH